MKPCLTGSSPLIRGKRGPNHSIGAQSGLIPAHAGKTSRSECLGRRAGAHPRSRGENSATDRSPIVKAGSSPLTRGKLQIGELAPPAHGLIPAHAGKMEQRSPPRLIQRAHPRSREENRAEKAHPAFQKGSSPLTRGKRYRDVRGWLQGRLIPAHVGKTMTAPPVAIHRRAHPRSRGENTGWLSEGGHHYGSSPLTRGKPAPSWSAPRTRGLIPTHAGKT